MSAHREIFVEPEQIDPERPHLLAIEAKASSAMAEHVMLADVGLNGRSDWMWFRLANGDLILGCWPLGETYEATESDPNRP
jgi:hypothetical protein